VDVILSVVIVSYNTASYLRKCLESIFKHTSTITYEVIVVDNASKDGSVEMIRKDFPEIRLFAMPENLGFTKGNNVGIKAAAGKYVLILNPDTEINDNAFVKIVEFLEKNPQAVGATCKLVGVDGKWQMSAFRYPTLFTKWLFYSVAMLLPLPPIEAMSNVDVLKPFEADWIVGAAMIIRTEALKNVGGFDEKIFMFSEDVDLCIRLKKATGKKIYYTPGATIIHVGRVSHSGNLFPMQCGFRSTCYYFNKHSGTLKAQVFKTLTRFSWALTLLPLWIANLATLFCIPKLRKRMKIYFDMLMTPADCMSGTT
jgi:GT2 family glycosyltransferase